MAERVIRCTRENGAAFQKAVRAWPELHALVKDLQAQDLFPGLSRATITLTGSAEHCAQGLGALTPETAPEGRHSDAGGVA